MLAIELTLSKVHVEMKRSVCRYCRMNVDGGTERALSMEKHEKVSTCIHMDM